MKVVCISQNNKLTQGKIYTVKWMNESSYKSDELQRWVVLEYYYAIVDDSGQTSLINKIYFIGLDEWRENKLSELGI